MSNTKHTPGPWHTGGDGKIIYSNDGWAVANATVFHGRADPHHEAESNARLIAATPELLAALHEVVAAFDSNSIGDTDTVWVSTGMPQTLYDCCLAAIEKATGVIE